MAKKERVEITTPKFRVSFPSLTKTTTYQGKDTGKYEVTMLFDKSTDLTPLKAAVKQAVDVALASEFKGKLPEGFKMPFKKGDDSKYKGYEGTIWAKAKSTFMPKCFDTKLSPIIDVEKDVYAGCYARASITVNVYQGGVNFYLNAIQKLGEGEKLSGSDKAPSGFSAIDSESEDESNYAKDDLFDL